MTKKIVDDLQFPAVVVFIINDAGIDCLLDRVVNLLRVIYLIIRVTY